MNAICQNWQGLIQMLVYLFSRGYYFYCPIILQAHKQEKWTTTDAKLIDKYNISRSKFQRCRRKQKGLASFYYLRWQAVGCILHTQGDIQDVPYDDTFFDIRQKPLTIPLTETTQLIIYTCATKDGKVHISVRMTPAMIKGLKAVLSEVAKSKNIKQMKYEFNKMNGLPAYTGIIEQKQNLAKHLIKQAQKHQVSLKASNLRINTRLSRYKVFTQS